MHRRRVWLVAAIFATILTCRGTDPAVAVGSAARLIHLLALEAGDPVAEIGAGEGDLTVEIARALGPASRVYTTELADELDGLRETVAESGLENVVVIEALPDSANLSAGCCEAIFMQRVYHHFRRPERNSATLLRALRPGGRLAILDFEPKEHWDQPEGTPESRGGHGMPSALLLEELERAGFELIRIERDWPDDLYAVLVRKPPS
ncbi:MAG TPA: methyltransferase domain-containing protein [Thermoanaerobaculia bacterium]|nr:methyltransferase domain-containing protein [Thermoanaerobaculia bacterium]